MILGTAILTGSSSLSGWTDLPSSKKLITLGQLSQERDLWYQR